MQTRSYNSTPHRNFRPRGGESSLVEMRSKIRVMLLLQWGALAVYAQQAPPSPDKAWPVSGGPHFRADLAQTSAPGAALAGDHPYTLAELVDYAERNNPETRITWERAKQRAADAGIARGALFPTLAAMASASINQYSQFLGKFYHEDTGVFPAALNLNYTVFDFGARSSKIDQAKANLLVADLEFNDTHRQIIFDVAEAYYQLLDAMDQEGAAQATLKDAQTVQEAVEARLANGLATLPDVLEARAATAQAQYEVASIQGLEEIGRGALAAILGAPPSSNLRVEDDSTVSLPESAEEPVETFMQRALAQRPDLLAQVAKIQSADAGIRQARSAYYPVLGFSASWGHTNAFGQQRLDPEVHSSIYPYQLQVKLNWNIFDGGARENELARARSAEREAHAQAALSRDQIEREIWTAYTNLKTARKQKDAADALLQAAEQSYSAATESFQAGVRTFIDVTTAQRDLARARTAQATARVKLLASFADLAFRAADPIPATRH